MNKPIALESGRREFLGVLGLVLASPIATAPVANTFDSTPVFSESLRRLITSMRLDESWRWNFDALIESNEQPPSEWIIKPHSRLSIAMDCCSLTPKMIASQLKVHGVRAQCELDYSRSDINGKTNQQCFVEITVCNGPVESRELWKKVEACQQHWNLTPSQIAGEFMFVSQGGNAVAGKSWFMRANILASVVVFFVPPEESALFAAKLDEHICYLLSQ